MLGTTNWDIYLRVKIDGTDTKRWDRKRVLINQYVGTVPSTFQLLYSVVKCYFPGTSL